MEAHVHAILRGVPRSAIPSDIRRLIRKSNVEGVASVMLNYYRFMPTGSAYLTFTRPNYVVPALRALKGASIASIPVRATSCSPPKLARTRGVEGRTRAAEREALDGCGPRAGLGLGGQNVIVWGLPENLSEAEFRSVLCDIELAGTAGGMKEIHKVLNHQPSFPVRSFLVRTASKSEAHRLVRRMHMTYFRPDELQDSYLVMARIIY